MSYWIPKIMHNQMHIQIQNQEQNEIQMWTQNEAEKKMQIWMPKNAYMHLKRCKNGCKKWCKIGHRSRQKMVQK